LVSLIPPSPIVVVLCTTSSGFLLCGKLVH